MPKRPLLSALCLPLAAAFLNPPRRSSHISPLHGLSEWREEALSTAYTLEAYRPNPLKPPQTIGTVPILPFPFNDILLPGQTMELNLYEERFHKLFEDALENHSVIAMGLLAGGTGMMTLLPLLEIESFKRVDFDSDWPSKMDGMGKGSILVTVRSVGRAKIVDELEQEEPYMRAKVIEVVDESNVNGVGMVKEKGAGVVGESNEVELGSMVAASIETLILNLSSLEHRWNEWKDEMTKKRDEKNAGVIEDENGNKISRSAVNAQLEALFNKDTISADGVELPTETKLLDEEEDEPNDEDFSDDQIIRNDRRARYYKAFEDAKISDTQGYISPAVDPKKTTIRSLKDLTAISWAVFCTADPVDLSETEEIQYNVFKIQALDTKSVLQRLNLGAAMLRMEKKKLKAKLALAGKPDKSNEDM